jgi:hypothetical protein
VGSCGGCIFSVQNIHNKVEVMQAAFSMFLTDLQMTVDGDTIAVQFYTFLTLKDQLHVPLTSLLKKNPWH